ncbi:MAG: hypothetical protein IPM48_14395 [Saprospiraceae bacterium]|nr:hypothetical protein [Saprospiraceae bacterium]
MTKVWGEEMTDKEIEEMSLALGNCEVCGGRWGNLYSSVCEAREHNRRRVYALSVVPKNTKITKHKK